MYSVQTFGTADRQVRPTVQLVELTPALGAQLEAAARADRHRVIAPTHAVVKAGRVIGYGSLGSVRLFFAWMDTRHATARDSFEAWKLAEQEMADRQAEPRLGVCPTGVICMPCEAGSPFAPFMEKRGYERLGPAIFHLKKLD